ncbi:MAG: hypothetical protein R2731_11655 [Nocardioides sp.]
MAAVVARDDGSVTQARAGYLSVSEVPAAVDLTTVLADGPTETALAAAGEEALSHLDPMADIHATADYRAHLVRVLTRPRAPGGVRRRGTQSDEGAA